MNTQMINPTDELNLDELNQVSGGIPPMVAFGAAAGLAVGGAAAYYVGSKLKEAADGLSSGVMAREDGTDCTGHNPNSPMTSAPFS